MQVITFARRLVALSFQPATPLESPMPPAMSLWLIPLFFIFHIIVITPFDSFLFVALITILIPILCYPQIDYFILESSEGASALYRVQ